MLALASRPFACLVLLLHKIFDNALNRFRIKDFQHAYKLVFEYIDAFYNTIRIHSHCDFLSPVDFENLYNNSASSLLALVG